MPAATAGQREPGFPLGVRQLRNERCEGRELLQEVGIPLQKIGDLIGFGDPPRLGPDQMDNDPALADVVIQQLQQQPAAIAEMLLVPDLRIRLAQVLGDPLAIVRKIRRD